MKVESHIRGLDELREAIREEYEMFGAGFSSRTLHDIVDNVKYRVHDQNVVREVDEYLDRHLGVEEVVESACRLGERVEPPCYSAFVLEVLRDELAAEFEKPDPRTLGDEVLYCFDRDATVETGIPRGPVPLSTVRRLSEEDTVYATGNQRLRREARIPGVKDLHDGYASRKDGISIVWQNESEKVDAAVAIDDVDVSDVSDLDVYYEPWEFYLAFRGGDV